MVNPEPTLTVKSANITTLRIPNFSIKAAAKGETNPKSRTLIAIASEISERLQPKDSSSGVIKTDGADLNPAVAINVTYVTATAAQPG